MGPTTELLVTVPNAFQLDALLSLLRGVEYVHPDHTCWFSYRTLTHLLRRHGFEPSEVCVYSFLGGVPTAASDRDAGRLGLGARLRRLGRRIQREPRLLRGYLSFLPRSLVARALFRASPFWGDGLIAVARLDPGTRAP